MSEVAASPDITLALPAYNEQDNITNVLDQSAAAMEQLGRTWEILVIDNHSSDRTPQVVAEYARREPRVRLIVHDENRLYSGSCATALREAKGKYLAIMDSDGQFTAADLPKFLEKLQGGANFVNGWRRERHDPFLRLVMSSVFNLLGKLWLGFPLHDLNCGIRMFDRKFMAAAAIKHRINMANPEFYVRAKLAGLVLDEVPIQHAERKAGVTSHDLGKMWRIFVTVNRYFRDLGRELKGKS